MPQNEQPPVRFSLKSLFWATAGIGFLLEHMINATPAGNLPSATRFVWMVVFLVTWWLIGHFLFLRRI